LQPFKLQTELIYILQV